MKSGLESKQFSCKISAQIQQSPVGQTDANWAKPSRTEVKLKPTIPPGRPNRKARAFSAEITRLIKDGYGCKAIHKALTDAGVTVSKSTVQREVARAGQQRPTVASATASKSIKACAGSSSPSAIPLPALPALPAREASTSNNLPQNWQRGRDVAEAYMENRITNPFVLAKEKR